MADPYPEYDVSTNETVPPTIQAVVPVGKSMGAVEVGVIGVAIAITVLTLSAALAVSKRQ